MSNSGYSVEDLMQIPADSGVRDTAVLIWPASDPHSGFESHRGMLTADQRSRIEQALTALKEAGEIGAFEIVEHGSGVSDYHKIAQELLKIAYDGAGSGEASDDLIEEVEEELGEMLMVEVECPHCNETFERGRVPESALYSCPECGEEVSL